MKFALERFLTAQQGTFDQALAELERGRKESHWMWFVFPQIEGLGGSATARHFAIRSLEEARAFAGHPVLGSRLEQAAKAMLKHRGRSAEEILGPVDALKLRSSMTLFRRAAPDRSCFGAVLAQYYEGVEDPATIARLTGQI